MDESLILARLDKLSEEIQSLKSGVLDELKEDLQPIIKQATPHVMNFLSDVNGQYSNEDLAQLAKNIMLNLQNLNGMINMIHAGMELKDDMNPIIQQVLPKATEFLGEVDGKFKAEELVALIRKLLSNLENFNSALEMLKAGMELKDDAMPIIQQILPKVTSFLGEVDGQFKAEELVALTRKLLSNLENFNSALEMLKAGMELKDDAMPIIQQILPKVTSFLGEVDGQFKAEELVALVRKLLSNLENFNSALEMLKAGMELKDDMMPIIQQILPKVTSFLGEVDGQFKAEELVALVRKLLSGLENFNTAMNMLKAGMELKDDMMPIIQQLLPKVIGFLNEVEQRGVFRIINRLMDVVSGFRCSEGQLGTMCEAIEHVDLGKPYYLGPAEILNEIRDPNVQETLGFAFKIMRAVGCCLRANRIRQVAEDYPESTMSSEAHV